jgi:periplasmic mercuric ion binding protein
MRRIASIAAAILVAASVFAATRSVTLSVSGWTCGSCAAATRIALKKLDGVAAVSTDAGKAEAVVTYDDSKVTPEEMIRAVSRLGYAARVRHTASAPGPPSRPGTDASFDIPESPESVSFFEVPLKCGAAQNLGCGSLSKPILKAIGRDSRVREARINRPGTLLAVVWTDPAEARSGAQAVEAVFQVRDLDAAVLGGAARQRAQKEFESERWYGARDVDRLSEHEAQVIAARLINRARGHLGLSPQKLDAFQRDLSRGIAVILTRDQGDNCARDPFAALTAISKKYLTDRQIAELRKAAQEGADALPGER